MKSKVKQIALALVLLLVCTAFLAACGGQSDSTTNTSDSGSSKTTEKKSSSGGGKNKGEGEKVFLFGYPEHVQFWDPADNFNIVSFIIENCLYDTLVRFNEEEKKFIPHAATEWSTDDGIVWNFKLRDDIKFHNGEEFNAESVKLTLERFTQEQLRRGSRWSTLDEVEIVNDYEVNVKFNSPTGTCLSSLATTPLLPPKAFNEKGADLFNNPIGSGPFKFEEWVKDQYILLDKNDDYWGPKAKVDKIKYLPIMEDSTRVAGLQTGDLHAAAIIPSDQAEILDNDPNVEVVTMAAVDQIYFGFKCDQPPFNDKKCRKAASLAIDRKGICESLFTAARPATCGIPKGCIGYYDGYPEIERDVEKAKQLLAESSYDGQPFHMILPLGWYSKTREVGQIIKANLEEVGFKVEQEYLEGAAFAEKRAAGNYQIYYTGASFVGLDPDQFYYMRIHDDALKSGYRNEELNKAIEESREGITLQEREAAFKKAMDIMLEEVAPHTYIYQQEVIYAKRNNVKDIGFTRDRVVDLRYVDYE